MRAPRECRCRNSIARYQRLQAQLAQAQATVDSQKAQLANLQAGAQPADIGVGGSLAGGQQTLANQYGSIDNTISTAYAQANDAVRTNFSHSSQVRNQ